MPAAAAEPADRPTAPDRPALDSLTQVGDDTVDFVAALTAKALPAPVPMAPYTPLAVTRT